MCAQTWNHLSFWSCWRSTSRRSNESSPERPSSELNAVAFCSMYVSHWGVSETAPACLTWKQPRTIQSLLSGNTLLGLSSKLTPERLHLFDQSAHPPVDFPSGTF